MSIFDHCADEVGRFDAFLGKADELDVREPVKKVVEKAIRLAESLIERYPDDSDAHQMLGLAWYYFPGSSSWRSWHCRRALERALAIDPDHQFALQYLAYLKFDQERYGEALELLARLGTDDFKELGQEWRALKSCEMMLVCRIRLDPHTFPQEDFDAFASWFQDARAREERDVEASCFVWPQELRECAEWMFEAGIPADGPALKAILRFIAENGLSDSSWNPRLETLGTDGSSADVEERRR